MSFYVTFGQIKKIIYLNNKVKYTKEEEARIDMAIQIIEDSPIWIEHIPNFNIEDIERTIKKYKLNHKENFLYLLL